MRDRDIRFALREQLELEHASERGNTLILDELGLCQGVSRIDMAVVNGAITGYEIKSPADNLNRLPQQQEIYSKTLDKVIIVAGEAHVEHVFELVPDWWGISVPIVVNDAVVFSTIREATTNQGVDAFSVAQLLWRDEALEELKERGLARGVLSKPRAAVWNRLAESLPLQELKAVVRDKLKSRTNWRVD